MRELKVSSSDEGIRLNKLVGRYLDAAPQSFIYKMLRKKNIVLNDKKASGDERLSEGDSVKLYLAEDTIEGFIKKKHCDEKALNEKALNGKALNGKASGDAAGLKILFGNDDILAVSKPEGLLTQKAKAEDHSLNDDLLAYYEKSGRVAEPGFKPSVANRLDRNTTGIVLCGISPKGSRRLSAALKDHSIEKYYFTVCRGKLDGKKTVEAYIEREGLISTVSEKASNKALNQAERVLTHLYPLDTNGSYSLLLVKLETGKTHQIRASLKSIGMPVVGDAKYGSSKEDINLARSCGVKHHLLHAGTVVIPAGVIDDKEHVISDGLPIHFQKLAKKLSLDISKTETDKWLHGIHGD